jgi:hypothetical protein
MADIIDNPIPKAQFYDIVSIVKSDPPEGTEGTNWHCYVIEQGTNTIRGYRKGNLKTVRFDVEEIVAQLNERRLGKRGRVNIVPTTNKNAAPAKNAPPANISPPAKKS